MERRVLVAVFLSFLVLYGYQTFVLPPPTPPQAQQELVSPAEPSRGAPDPQVTPPSTAQATPAPESVPTDEPTAMPAAPAAVLIGDEVEREIVVETGTVEATLSNRGGRILHWRLKTYTDSLGDPVDLVPSDLPPGSPTPFSLRVDDAAITACAFVLAMPARSITRSAAAVTASAPAATVALPASLAFAAAA